MTEIKKANFAGSFYSSNKEELNKSVEKFIQEGKDANYLTRAVIVPHAGYIFSGPIAGTGYRILQKNKNIDTVTILAPSHSYPFEGIAYHSADYFETPLGKVEVEKHEIEKIAKLPQVSNINKVFEAEHSLEVQIPFIQKAFEGKNVKIIPLIVGFTKPEEVAKVIEKLWEYEKTAFVASTDLSHFLNASEQKKKDGETIKKIENLNFEDLQNNDLCGYNPVRGLVKFARDNGYKIANVDKGDSSSYSGDTDKVVGYGAFVLYQ